MKSNLLSIVVVSFILMTPFRMVSQTTPCAAPTNLHTFNISTTGASISWTAPQGGAAAYMVQYRPVTVPASAWINITSQTNSITLANLSCGTQYEWHVATYCVNSSGSTNYLSPYSQSITFTTNACAIPCHAPTNLHTFNITTTGATISWTAPPGGAAAYMVQYRPVTVPASAWINITSQTNSITLANLSCGTQYEWHVATYCGTSPTPNNNISPYSQSITFTTNACAIPCHAPTNLHTSNITTTGATISWTAPPGGAAAYMVQYRPVTVPASAWINITSQTNSITLANLSCGTQYEWHVATYCGNSSGSTNYLSPYSQSITFTTNACAMLCLAPTNLHTSNITTTGATISWTAPAGGALGYVVQFRPVTVPASAWTNLNSQTNSITLANLSCGKKYEWRVATYCGGGNNTGTNNYLSPYSQIILFSTAPCTTPCVAPTNLHTSNITATGATISWTAPAGGALGYVVQFRPVTVPASAWTNLNSQTNSITLANLSCGTKYEWRVATYCGTATTPNNNISPYSQIILFSTAPCATPCVAPTNLHTTNITATGATISWTAPAGGALGYVVQFRPVTVPASAWTNLTSQTNSITLTNLSCGTKYEWRVATYCGGGSNTSTNNYLSPYSQFILFSTAPCTTPCVAPTNLHTFNITTTGATISWTAPAGGALGYVVQFRPVTAPASAWVNVNSQNTSIILSNLTCGKQYEWRVATYCSNQSTNISSYSSSIFFTTLPCPNNACTVPTGLTNTIVSINPSSIILSWDTTNALSYNIRYRKIGSTTYTALTSAGNSIIISGLQSGQYEWQVQSVCSSGGAYSFVSAWSVLSYFSIQSQNPIFPNPVIYSNNIHLPINIENETKFSINITDHHGNIIKMYDRTVTSGITTLDIDITNLKNGVYLVHITGDYINEIQKIIIMK